jgi:signal transduction histidine kinase
VHPLDVESRGPTLRAAIAEGQPYHAELRLQSRTAEYRWHDCQLTPERGSSGAIVRWLGTFTDVEDLRQAIAARDEFLSIASHELRTPLTALQLRLQNLRRGLSTATHQMIEQKLDSAIEQSRRLDVLIESLLDVSRVATGHLALELEPFDLGDAVRSVVERAAEAAARAQCRLEVRAHVGVIGNWDRLRVEQMVTNLLSNAFKYAAAKPVEIDVEAERDRARLKVTDHGIGMADADLNRIFERFERLAQTRNHGGLGMGLYITRQIVHGHGGTISVTSKPGAGSTFVVELPREPQP